MAQKIVVKTIDQVAAFLKLSRRQVQTHLARGMPGKPGCYDLAKIVQWMRANVWKSRPSSEDPSSFNSPALERFRAAKADEAELRLRQLNGELSPISEFEWFATQLISVVGEAAKQIQKIPDSRAYRILEFAIDDLHSRIRQRWGDAPEDAGKRK